MHSFIACFVGLFRVAQSSGRGHKKPVMNEAITGEWKSGSQRTKVTWIQRQTGERKHLLRRQRRAYAHNARDRTRRGHADDAGLRCESVLGGGGFVGQQQRAGAIVHAAGVVSRHGAVGPHHALELGECFEAGLARVFVGVHDEGIALLLRDAHGADLARQVTGLDRGHSLHLASQRHAVLRFAFDTVVGGHVLGRFGHGVHAVLGFHQLVDQAPADGGVVDGVVAAESTLGLWHDERRAVHAFHAAGDHQAGFAALDGACDRAHGVQAGAAQAVDGGAGHLQW